MLIVIRNNILSISMGLKLQEPVVYCLRLDVDLLSKGNTPSPYEKIYNQIIWHNLTITILYTYGTFSRFRISFRLWKQITPVITNSQLASFQCSLPAITLNYFT